ncbi:MAG: hypothetical protein ACNYPI_01300 [Arenicellales bacterium WSBS_2016_MAG_OTU3]
MALATISRSPSPAAAAMDGTGNPTLDIARDHRHHPANRDV